MAVDVASAPSDPAAVTASAVDPDFNGVFNNVPPMIVITNRDLLEFDGVQPTMFDATAYRVLLAAFTIEGGSLLGETTTVRMGDYESSLTPGADENTFCWDDIAATNPLNAVIGAGSFDVTVVPVECEHRAIEHRWPNGPSPAQAVATATRDEPKAPPRRGFLVAWRSSY